MDAVLISGQSTTGKTRIVQILEKSLRVEVINCDRFSFYKDIKAGRDAPVNDELNHFYHILDLDENTWSPSLYSKKISALIPKICERGNIPIIEGFSGGYLRELLSKNFSEDIHIKPLICLAYPMHTDLVELLGKRVDLFMNGGALEEADYLEKQYPDSFIYRQSSVYQPISQISAFRNIYNRGS